MRLCELESEAVDCIGRFCFCFLFRFFLDYQTGEPQLDCTGSHSKKSIPPTSHASSVALIPSQLKKKLQDKNTAKELR